MAAARKEYVFLFVLYFFISASIYSVVGKRTKDKIYIDLKTQSACFRNLNATHQAGCTSATKGNVGTVHYIRTDADFEWILVKGHQPPYVAVLDSNDFNGTSVHSLYTSPRVNGIMVINILQNAKVSVLPYPPAGFSSVDPCPNDQYGLYHNTTYGGCSMVTWNVPGTSLHFQDIGIPIFALSDADDVDAVLNKCFYGFNNDSIGYPVCAAEMKSRMDAAVDSVTCMRRSNRFALSLSGTLKYCDPLGDKNVFVTMKNKTQNETRENKSVILIGARLDSTSLFQNEYQAADTTVTAVVTLLATAEALFRAQSYIQNNSTSKDILFTFFQGETFDYIGSSRMVYDMNQGKFPQDYEENKTENYLQRINLDHLDQIVELNQVGRKDDQKTLWIHTDPTNMQHSGHEVGKMIDLLRYIANNAGLLLNESSTAQPLPPASAQRFLKSKPDIPVMVITNHNKSFINRYYNSRFDTGFQISVDYPKTANESEKYDYTTKLAKHITKLASVMAQYLYSASMGHQPPPEIMPLLNASTSTINHLIYCFLVSPNCELFAESVDEKDADSLKKAQQPFPFYVSVSSHTNEVTQLVQNLLARYTGTKVNSNKEHCKEDNNDKRFSYIWMQGTVKGDSDQREGWCFKSLVHDLDAVSPAFVIDGYDMLSGEYSTWTESRWGTSAIGVRLFLVPSQQFQISLLMVGILTLVISLAAVYIFQSRSSVLFGGSRQRSGMTYDVIS